MNIYKKAKIRYNEINLAYVCMETNSGVVANTLNRILRYKGSTLYRALTVYRSSPYMQKFILGVAQNSKHTTKNPFFNHKKCK